MIKKLIYFIVGITIIVILAIFYQALKQKVNESGFNRKFNQQKMIVSKVFELPSATKLYFIGSTKSGLYFKNLSDVNHLVFIDDQLSQLQYIPIDLPLGLNKRPNAVNIGIADSIIYLTEDKSGRLTTIDISTSIKKSFVVNGPAININTSFLLPGNSILARRTLINEKKLSRELIKLNTQNSTIEKAFELKKQVDGFFCTDGTLKFDPASAKLFYVYAYRGQFICLDSNLNLLYRVKTIDTVTTAKIKLNENKQNKLLRFSQAGPPEIVNRNFLIGQDEILILSALKADNEDFFDFKNNAVMDVYDSKNGKYKYSFYIPKYKGIKLRGFYLKDDFLYCIFDHYLVKFRVEKSN